MRSPLNPAVRLVNRIKWIDLAPYVTTVEPMMNIADPRASGLRQLLVSVETGKARTKFPKYKVDLKHCDDCDPKLTVTFVNGTKVEIDARRKDFEELCRELGPFLRDAVRKDELDGVMREGLDWERD